jgi:hypothetical protein
LVQTRLRNRKASGVRYVQRFRTIARISDSIFSIILHLVAARA